MMDKIGKKKLNRLIKLLILANTYHEDPEWDGIVKSAVKDKIFDMAMQWNFPPDIFSMVTTYEEAIEFILKEQKDEDRN